MAQNSTTENAICKISICKILPSAKLRTAKIGAGYRRSAKFRPSLIAICKIWGVNMGKVFEKEKEFYFDFLYALRKTGVTNMFGAAPYLVEAFPVLTLKEAREVLTEWMNNFDDSRQ